MGITQHVIVIQQKRPTAQIGNTGIVVVFVRKRYGLTLLAAECRSPLPVIFALRSAAFSLLPLELSTRASLSVACKSLGQAVTDIQTVIVYPTRQTIVVRCRRPLLPILLNITLASPSRWRGFAHFIPAICRLPASRPELPSLLSPCASTNFNGAVTIIDFSER